MKFCNSIIAEKKKILFAPYRNEQQWGFGCEHCSGLVLCGVGGISYHIHPPVVMVVLKVCYLSTNIARKWMTLFKYKICEVNLEDLKLLKKRYKTWGYQRRRKI